MQIQTTIGNGFPCIASVTSYSAYKSNWSPSWERSLPDDPEEISFDLLTLRGKPAAFLYRIATEQDMNRIREELSYTIAMQRWSHDYA